MKRSKDTIMLKQKIKKGVENCNEWISDNELQLRAACYGTICMAYGVFVARLCYKAKEANVEIGLHRLHKDGFIKFTRPNPGSDLLIVIDNIPEWLERVKEYYGI